MGRGRVAWIVFGVVTVVCLAAAVAAGVLLEHSWRGFTGYRSPYLGIGSSEATAAPPLAGRVVVVIVDGLRVDASRRMRSLEGLRRFGASYVLTVPEPSLTGAARTTMLSGAPPSVSGVTVQARGRIEVQTLLDRALDTDLGAVVVGTRGFGTVAGAERTAAVLRDARPDEHLVGPLITEALRLAEDTRARLILVHVPDLADAAYENGLRSSEYAEALTRVDRDLARLVEGLRDPETTFVVVGSHGLTADGGTGGWELEVARVPAVLSGAGVRLAPEEGAGRLEDVAPTVTALLGVPSPRQSLGRPLAEVLSGDTRETREAARRMRFGAVSGYLRRVGEGTSVSAGYPGPEATDAQMDAAIDRFGAARRGQERRERLPVALAVAACAPVALAAIGTASPRALLAALAGALAYHAVFGGLYFGVHGYRWSLSSLGAASATEFAAARLGEAVLAALVAALIAGLVYTATRSRPRGVGEGYGGGWATLGAVTMLAILSTLALQVAYYLWAYGVLPTWELSGGRLTFKFWSDLVQAMAVGASALLASVVTYLVGRYHPRVVRAGRGE